ncbi:hypothetical protein BUE67_16130, partial [Corynebacterium diphtheriae]
IEQSECQRAIILPNNKNIRMSSDQAAQLVKADTVVIEQSECQRAIILPNNKNIRMSSDQAAQLVKADT